MSEQEISVEAHHKFARVSPQKARLVADQVRKMSVQKAMDLLTFSNKKSSDLILKVLNSAVANAEHNFGLDVDELYISEVYINEAPTFERFMARAKGRGARITKRNSHITVKVKEKEVVS